VILTFFICQIYLYESRDPNGSLLGSDPDPDPDLDRHQKRKSDPDLHNFDADPQH